MFEGENQEQFVRKKKKKKGKKKKKKTSGFGTLSTFFDSTSSLSWVERRLQAVNRKLKVSDLSLCSFQLNLPAEKGNGSGN